MVGEVKQIENKIDTYYFYSDMINLKNSESKLLKFDKKHNKEINIYYIGYITINKIDDYESIYSVNPMHLRVKHPSGYINENNGNKYLIFHGFVDENKELLK